MTLYEFLAAQPELAGRVCVARPDAIPPETYVIVEEQGEIPEWPGEKGDDLALMPVRAHLYVPDPHPAEPGRGKTAAVTLYRRLLAEVPRRVTAHPSTHLYRLHPGSACLPPVWDGEEQRWFAVLEFDLRHYRP